MRVFAIVLLIGSTLATQPGFAQRALSESAERQVASAFATALVLTDAEAVTFGSLSFDPDRFISLGDEFGNEDSLRRRRSVRTFALPIERELAAQSDSLVPFIRGRLSYFEAEQNVVFADAEQPGRDRLRDRVYGLDAQGGLRHQLNEQWQLVGGLGLHWLRYDNRYEYNNPVSEALRGNIDENLFNADASAVIGELETRLIYRGQLGNLPWRWRSTLSYYAGQTVGSNDLAEAEPETWTWQNGLSLRWAMPELFSTSNALRLSLRRVELGGDAVEPMGNDRYYEFAVGWLFDTPRGPDWLDNIGLGLALNTGSALSGGSLVLLYNEEF